MKDKEQVSDSAHLHACLDCEKTWPCLEIHKDHRYPAGPHFIRCIDCRERAKRGEIE